MTKHLNLLPSMNTSTTSNPDAVRPAAHTPTPWFVEHPFQEPGIYIGSDSTALVAKVYDARSRMAGDNEAVDAEGEANAAFIVRACNSHDALVEALQSVMNNVDMQKGAGEDMLRLRWDGDCLSKVRTALERLRRTPN